MNVLASFGARPHRTAAALLGADRDFREAAPCGDVHQLQGGAPVVRADHRGAQRGSHGPEPLSPVPLHVPWSRRALKMDVASIDPADLPPISMVFPWFFDVFRWFYTQNNSFQAIQAGVSGPPRCKRCGTCRPWATGPASFGCSGPKVGVDHSDLQLESRS